MEPTKETKRVWQTPEIEVINTKMTQGGSYSWDRETSWYYDNYAS